MQCNEFQQWLSELSSIERLSNVPDKYQRHKEQCEKCAQAFGEMRNYYTLLQSAHTPEQDDTFWEHYLSTVLARVREKRDTAEFMAVPRWVKQLLIPLAAVAILFAGVLLVDRFYPILDTELSQDEVFSSTFDFIWEEHERVLSGYMLDPTPIYAIEEIIPENWENSGVPEDKN